MAVQGFGNVGSVGALLIHRQGVKVVCVGDINGTWYNPNGLDIEAMYVYANSHGRSLKGYTEAGQPSFRIWIFSLRTWMCSLWRQWKTSLMKRQWNW